VVKYSLEMRQDGAPAHRSHHTVAYLRSSVPEFIEPENWPPNSPALNYVNYLVCNRCIITKFQTLIDSSAQLSQDTLNQATDELPKRLTIVIIGKGWSCWISSGLTICVRDRPCFTVFRIKIENNSCVIVKFNAIWWGIDNVWKLGKKYLTALICKLSISF